MKSPPAAPRSPAGSGWGPANGAGGFPGAGAPPPGGAFPGAGNPMPGPRTADAGSAGQPSGGWTPPENPAGSTRRARLVPITAGLAVALGSSALSGVLLGHRWLWYVLAVVGLVMLLGLLARLLRAPIAAVLVVQVVGLVLLLTGLFSTDAVLHVFPGPGALAELGDGLAAAMGQIEGGVPPVPTSSSLALLVALGFGVFALVVDALAAAGHGPTACGLVLLGAYTVPTALAPRALPDWSLAAGAVGYVLVLFTEHRRRQARRGIPTAPPARRPGGSGPAQRAVNRLRGLVPTGNGTTLTVLLTTASVLAALGVGLLATPIGTVGRFAGGGHGDSGATNGQFGLNPFTSLRGQLDNDSPTELLRVRGLPSPQYLRSLTLNRYVPQQGWQLPDRLRGVTVDESLPSGMAVPVNNPTATVNFQNVGLLDQWLPLYGQPMGVAGVVSGRWHYDVLSGTAYTDLPVREPSWTERAALPDPSVPALEQAEPAVDVSPTFLDTGGVDPRITALAKAVTRQARSPFERAIALNRYFLDPAFGFKYSLKTRPGNSGDLLVDFLTRGKTGYCEQFASAMAVMLRTVGVPSRVAIGFSAGEQVGDYRSIGTSDAHAWVEAYFPGVGWLPFDPTPLDDGRSEQPDYVGNAPKVGINVPPSVQAGQPQPGPDGQTPGDQGQAGNPPPPPAGQPPAGPTPGAAPPPPAPPPGQEPPPGQAPAPGANQAGPTGSGESPTGPGESEQGAAGRQGDGARPGGSSGSGTGGDDQPGGSDGSEGSGGVGDKGPDAPGGDGAGPQIDLGGLLVALWAVLLVGLAVLVIAALACAPVALRGIARQRRMAQAARGGPEGAAAAWREVLAEFRDRGSEPASRGTLRGTARQLVRAHPLDADATGGMKTVIGALERGWYAEQHDPGPGGPLVSAVFTVREGLRRSAPLPLRARFWPRSALPSGQWWRTLTRRLRGRTPV